MHLVSESLVCYRSTIHRAHEMKNKTKQNSRAKRKEGVGVGVGVNGQPRYFKDGCLDLALHVPSTEGAQRDAERPPRGVQVVSHHLR